ncbi:MAG: hypothetical protein PUB00_01325 [Clostridiales bacterium]|nr:hypothetical protein [Clostridiales bacterium]
MLSNRKWLLGLLIPALLFQLSGCYPGTGTDNLLIPPKLTAEQDKIYQALEKTAGSNINLRYPQTGEYRSSFVLRNIDDEPGDETVVFYKTNVNTTNPTSLKVSVLDKDDLGNWYCAYDISGGGSDIHQLEFSSFGSFDQLFMIIGYNQAIADTGVNNADSELAQPFRQASNILHIYSYRNGEIKDLFSQEYSLMKVMDIDNDGYQEIVTIVDSKTGDKPSVKIIEYNTGVFYLSQGETVAMDDSVLSYVNVQSGFIGTNQSALYLDGVKEDGTTTTELLFYQDGLLQSAQLDKGVVDSVDTRKAGNISMDIDSDDVIEIPQLHLMPGYEWSEHMSTQETDKLYFTHWQIFSNGAFQLKKISYFNMGFNYLFDIPAFWQDNVTARKMAEENKIVFYSYDHDLQDVNEELLSIKVVNENSKAETEKEGYQLIRYSGQLYYYAKLGYPENPYYQIDFDTVSENFTLLK